MSAAQPPDHPTAGNHTPVHTLSIHPSNLTAKTSGVRLPMHISHGQYVPVEDELTDELVELELSCRQQHSSLIEAPGVCHLIVMDGHASWLKRRLAAGVKVHEQLLAAVFALDVDESVRRDADP